MSQTYNNEANGYVVPEKSKIIPIRSYQEDPKNQIRNGENNDNDDDPAAIPAPEYAMIELNGILISPVEFPTDDECRSVFGSDQRVELGKLYMVGPEKIPTMILGSHQLKGKVKKLKDPFCLMEKRYTNGTTDDGNNNNSNVGLSSSSKQIESYQIIGIVKEKFLFETYPKAIMR